MRGWDSLVKHVKAIPLADGFDEILVPGEKEAQASGLPFEEWHSIRHLWSVGAGKTRAGKQSASVIILPISAKRFANFNLWQRVHNHHAVRWAGSQLPISQVFLLIAKVLRLLSRRKFLKGTFCSTHIRTRILLIYDFHSSACSSRLVGNWTCPRSSNTNIKQLNRGALSFLVVNGKKWWA